VVSKFAFKFNLYRYVVAELSAALKHLKPEHARIFTCLLGLQLQVKGCTHSRVSDWSHGPSYEQVTGCWLSSTGVLTAK
jgi:hypothetical protein